MASRYRNQFVVIVVVNCSNVFVFDGGVYFFLERDLKENKAAESSVEVVQIIFDINDAEAERYKKK